MLEKKVYYTRTHSGEYFKYKHTAGGYWTAESHGWSLDNLEDATIINYLCRENIITEEEYLGYLTIEELKR